MMSHGRHLGCSRQLGFALMTDRQPIGMSCGKQVSIQQRKSYAGDVTYETGTDMAIKTTWPGIKIRKTKENKGLADR